MTAITRILINITILLLTRLAAPALPLPLFHVAVTEEFDTLAASGTSAILPAGWALLEAGSGANATYAAGTGSSSTGNTYSFGASGSGERALGALRSASVASSFGTIVRNETGATLAGLAIAYTGEQWRLGAIGRADRLDFAYSLDAASLGTGTWVDLDALDFTAPVTAGTVGALNGNLPGNRVSLALEIPALNLAPGAELWLRWTDFDAAGADDGLAIDGLALTALPTTSAPVPDRLPPAAIALALGGLWLAATGWRVGSAARNGLFTT